MLRRSIAGGVAAVVLGLAAPAVRAATPVPPTPPAAPPLEPTASARIDGFRSAHFGMSEEAVRAAIAADFHVSGRALEVKENPVQRTGVISIRVANLVPQGGIAEIAYIFGYHSRTLIEVNIVWSKATDPTITPSRLVANGETLQAYFERQGFAPGETARNALLPSGNVLLFRARDEDGHAVAVVLAGRRVQGGPAHGERLAPTALGVDYAADPTHPDVFELKKGTF